MDFRFVFQEKPTYEEISSHTPKIYPIFALRSQQKILHEGEFLENTGWQSSGQISHTFVEMFDRWIELFLVSGGKYGF